MSYYKLYQDAQRFWRWRYVASNGRTIADSGEGYYNKSDAENGIRIMKSSANSPVI